MDPEGDGMPYVPNELLGRLVGCRLYSVQFVLDYLQLRFDGSTADLPVLNCDVMPMVQADGEQSFAGRLGFADSLCQLIGQNVVATEERTGVGLRIRFSGGAVVALHPSVGDLVGPEIAYLHGFEDGQWMCWRPGEDSFEDLA